MTVPAGHTLWVWQDPPPQTWPAGYDRAIVKVFDGRNLVSADGFSWLHNYGAWRAKFGPERVGAWGVPYPQDGAALGQLISDRVERPSLLVLDVEDFGGVRWTPDQAHAVIMGFHAVRPSVPLGYSSYATRGQCLDHGIPQPQLDAWLDFSMPQVYYPYQTGNISQVLRDHRLPVVTLSPADSGQWEAVGRALTGAGRPVGFWRMGVSGWEEWAMGTPDATGPGTPAPPQADPMRPEGWQSWPAGRFVAWDGHGWWVTDGIHRRAATSEQAQGMVNLGHQVRWWPGCAGETGLVQLG